MKRTYNYKVNLPKVNFSKIFIFLVVILVLYYFISNSIIKYFILKSQYRELKNRLQEVKTENEWLQNEIYLLRTDTATIEYYIRKNLFYKKPTEKLVIIKTIVDNQRKD